MNALNEILMNTARFAFYVWGALACIKYWFAG